MKLITQLEGAKTPEDKQAALLAFFKTLVHETAHYADWLDGLKADEEPGDKLDEFLWYMNYKKVQDVDEDGKPKGEPYIISQYGNQNTYFYNVEQSKKWIENNKKRWTTFNTLPTVPNE